MASASDGVAATLSLQDHSINPFASPCERKFQLQLLLDHKEKQLQQAGALGQRILAQQIELEEKIFHLQDSDAARGDDDLRYRELADTIKAWDLENAQLSSAFSPKHSAAGTLSPPVPVRNFLHEPNGSSASAGRSRRAKNAAHRADDVEFAFEIGSGLLTEVRRLQSMLAERDRVIQDMKEEKDNLEKTVDSLRSALHSQGQRSDKLKGENWNLEVALQGLRAQLSDSQGVAQRQTEQLGTLLNTARESADQRKDDAERAKTALEAKHNPGSTPAQERAAGPQRGKSGLQSALDALKAEIDAKETELATAHETLEELRNRLRTPSPSETPFEMLPVDADEEHVQRDQRETDAQPSDRSSCMIS